VKAITEPERSLETQDHDQHGHTKRQATIVVGLGNDLLSDDGVGLYIARRLRKLLDPDHYEVLELSVGGMEMVEHLVGYRRAAVIDACHTGRLAPGTLRRYRPEDFSNSLRLGSFHTISFVTALELARILGADLPERIDVFAIEAEDVETVHEGCTPAVATSIQAAANEIARILTSEEETQAWRTDRTTTGKMPVSPVR
jgi:hydrogenase maturation protease